MNDTDEITIRLGKLSGGDPQAAEAVWDQYFEQLVRLAKKRLAGSAGRASDEEDVALSAMNSFFQGKKAGRFTDLNDSEDLRRILFTITIRKALSHRRKQLTQKRGEGQVRGKSVFIGALDAEDSPGIAEVMGTEPSPELVAQFSEQTDYLLSLLDDDPTLREVALLTFEGNTNAKIAKKLGRHEGTIERKLRVIRTIWKSHQQDAECEMGE